MTTTPFDFTPLLAPGLPPAAAPWTGLSTYSFVGGNNDPDGVPLEGLIEAINTVLRRDGRALATYNLAHGPLGYRPLRDFLVAKLKRDAGISCTADEILLVSGSLQALDLVNHTLLARGDTVIVEQETYQGSLTRLARLGVHAVGIPLDEAASVPCRLPARLPTAIPPPNEPPLSDVAKLPLIVVDVSVAVPPA